MAWVNCTECWVNMQTCCGRWNVCGNCTTKKQKQLRKEMDERVLKNQQNTENKEPVNVWDLDKQFCKCCWIPKNWCVCECKWK